MKEYTDANMLEDIQQILIAVKTIEEQRLLYSELNKLDLNPSSYYLKRDKVFTEEHKKNLMLLKIRYGA